MGQEAMALEGRLLRSRRMPRTFGVAGNQLPRHCRLEGICRSNKHGEGEGEIRRGGGGEGSKTAKER